MTLLCLQFSLSCKDKQTFCKGLAIKYFWLRGPDGLPYSYSALQVECEVSCKQYVSGCFTIKLYLQTQMAILRSRLC